MFISAAWDLRLFGIAGMIGGVLLILGDLLYNHIPGSVESPTVKLSRLPEERLIKAGVLGLIGSWFYTLASFQVFLAFQPAGEFFALLVFLAFAAVMIAYGVGHTAYFSIAAGAKVAAQLGSDAETGGRLGNTFFRRLAVIIYIPAGISTLMMIYGIAAGQSMYPRWMFLFLPVITYLLKHPITRLLKGRPKEIIQDSYDNIVLFVFYVLSTMVLWNAVAP